jgi:hypothetical protein
MTVIAGFTEEPVEPVSRKWTAAISLANLGLFMAYFGPLAVLMPDQVQDISGQAHKYTSAAVCPPPDESPVSQHSRPGMPGLGLHRF